MNPSTVKLLQKMQNLSSIIEQHEITEDDIVAIQATRRPGIHLEPEKFDDIIRRVNLPASEIETTRDLLEGECDHQNFRWAGIDFVTVREPSKQEAVPPVPEASQI